MAYPGRPVDKLSEKKRGQALPKDNVELAGVSRGHSTCR